MHAVNKFAMPFFSLHRHPVKNWFGWIVGGGTSNHRIGTEWHKTKVLRTCAVHVSSCVHICETMFAVYQTAQHTHKFWAAKCVGIWTRELMETLHRIHRAWHKFHQVNLNAHKALNWFFSVQIPSPTKFSIQNADKVETWWIESVPAWDIFAKNNYHLFSALYLQTFSSLASQSCCGPPRTNCVGTGFYANALLTQRSAGKFSMNQASFKYKKSIYLSIYLSTYLPTYLAS